MSDYGWMITGALCWVCVSQGRTTESAFSRGEIVSEPYKQMKSQGMVIKVVLQHQNGSKNGGEIEVSCDTVSQRTAGNVDFNDMVRMSIMNEAELIRNLQDRYNKNAIFTYIGPTLIVMNPYKHLEEQVNAARIESIKSNLIKNFDLFSLDMQDPHVYAIAALSYKNLMRTTKKQSIVISGESGAGKTENARYAMRFLTQLSHKTHNDPSKVLGETSNIEEKILSCNPVLEAFGNAKTVRNDNSSRFGKYVKIFVDLPKERITGAAITKYLLEKSRVIHISEGERNYHIFYQLLASKHAQILSKALLTGKSYENFDYLVTKDGSNARSNLSMDSDRELFGEIVNSFKVMRFNQELIDAIFASLSAILFLGNVKFVEAKDNTEPCTVSQVDDLTIACRLLGIQVDQLTHALVFKTRILPGGEKIHSPCTKNVCQLNKDALSKALYDNLFNWLVNELNRGIEPDQQSATTSQVSSIGLLDIFGFENFKENSFEQMCINYTNEHLQQLYISYVFKNEERIFQEDGLSKFLSNLKYEDNAKILDLFDATMGIYNVLNSVCQLQKGDDQFLSELNRVYSQEVKVIAFPKNVKEQFTIHHTQSDVVYRVKAFTDKNVDSLSDQLKGAINASSNSHIKSIFFVDESNSNQSNQQSRFLGAKFKKQMKDLMEELRSSDAHFIRCVKPNEEKRKEYFVEGYALQQIQYLGVLNSIEVRKNTYPQRRFYLDFFKEYRVCDDVFEKMPLTDLKSPRVECENLLKKILKTYSESEVLFGTQKIYMKLEFESALDRIRSNEISRKRTAHALRIQRYYRYLLKHRKFIKKLKSRKQGLSLLQTFTFQKLFDLKLLALTKISSLSLQKKTDLSLNKLIRIINLNVLRSYFAQLCYSTNMFNQPTKQNETTIPEHYEEESKEHDTVQVTPPMKSQVESTKTIFDLKSDIRGMNQKEIIGQQFGTNKMTEIIIPEKNPNEIFVNPPMAEEHEDPLVLYILSGQIKEVDQARLKNNSLSAALDKQYSIKDIGQENMAVISSRQYIQFYESKLNVRRKFFGKKTTKDVLTFKPSKMNGGSLLPINIKEVSLALSHFEELLSFMREVDTLAHSLRQYYSKESSQLDGQELRLKTLLKFSQGQSIEFKNEIMTQILKQLNQNKNELYTLRLLHYLAVFSYCYKPEEGYIMAMLNFLIYDLTKQWANLNTSTITSYIEYVIPTLFRSTSYPEERVLLYNKHLLSEIKINAIIFQIQIKVPVTLAIGVFFYVDVDAWDNFSHLKVKTMRYLNVNDERLIPDLFAFFEVQTRDYEVFEKLLFPLEGVWDVIQTQEVQRRMMNEFESQNKDNSPKQTTFQFMFKPMFLFTVFPDDKVGINILQSQIYFDIYIAKIIVTNKEINIKMLAHLMNIIPVENVSQITPLNYSVEDIASIELSVNQEYQNNIKNNFTRLQSQYAYIQLAKNSSNLLGLQLKVKYCLNQEKTQQDFTMILNPSQMLFINNETRKEVKQYKFSDITHWFESDEEFFIIKTKDENRHILGTPFFLNIKYYIYLANELIKKQDTVFHKTVTQMYQSQSKLQITQAVPATLNDPQHLLQFQSLFRQS